MRREQRRRLREQAVFVRILLVAAVVAGIGGLLLAQGRSAPVEAPPREGAISALSDLDQRYGSQVRQLKSGGDKASRIALSQTLAQWANDANRQGELGRQAEQVARDLTRDFPTDPAGWSALGYALEVQGKLDEARAAYLKARSLAPTDSHIAWQLAHLDSLSGNDKNARALLTEVLVADPRHSQAQSLAGYYDVQAGKLREAIARFTTAVAEATTPRMRAEALLNLSQAQMLNKESAAALTTAKKATETDPSYSAGWVGYARVLLEQGNTDEARRSAQVALSLYPNQSHAHIVLAEVAKKVGDHYSATQSLERARAVLPDDNTVFPSAKAQLESILFLQSAREAAAIPDADVAVRILEEGRKKYPSAITALIRRDRDTNYPIFGKIKDDARFAAFVRALNLP